MLLVDARDSAHVLAVDLTELGMRTLRVTDGSAALRAVADHSPGAIVLHERLPGGSTVEWTRRIRAMSSAHLVVLADERREAAVLRVLDAGADDHVTTVCSATELAARLRNALARRNEILAEATQPAREVGRLRIDLATRTVTLDGAPLGLTRNEFVVLEVLARTPGRPVDRATLLTEGWGTTGGDPHLVDVHVSNLRRKLRHAGGSVQVQTVRGVGLRLHVPGTDGSAEPLVAEPAGD